MADDLMLSKSNDEQAPSKVVMDFGSLPKVTPPYSRMWIEATMLGQKCGFLVIREKHPDQDGWFVVVTAFMEIRGVPVGPNFPSGLHIDAEGKVTNVMVDDKSENASLARMYCYLVAETMARMNCNNVELVQVRSTKERKRRPRHEERDGIVWHEIKIDSHQVHQAMTGAVGTGDAGGDEILLRAHWVRGHFADYRKGKGLFGKFKVLLWVPEHRRGNEDKGETVKGYQVK